MKQGFSIFHRIQHKPLVTTVLGLVLIASGINDIISDLPDDLGHYYTITHHGIVLFGLLVVLRSLSEFFENTEKGSHSLAHSQNKTLIIVANWLLRLSHLKAFNILVSFCLIGAGLADAMEFLMESDYLGSSSGITLVLAGTMSLLFFLTGLYESVLKLSSENQQSDRNRMESSILWNIAVLIVALTILIFSIYEEVHLAEQTLVLTSHRATLLYSLSLTFRHLTKSANLILQSYHNLRYKH